MVTEDGRDVQREEKVGLKRKLTGPPRLLLGKTRTRSVEEERREAKTDNVDIVNESSLKSLTAAIESEITDLTETLHLQEDILTGVKPESCRGHREVRGEDCDIRYRKVNRRRWWRRFSSVIVCTRRQKQKVEECLEKKVNSSVTHTDGNERICEEKRPFNVTFRRFLTSSDVITREHSKDFVEEDGDKSSLTFQKKLRRFFTRAGRSGSSAVSVENTEDTIKLNEAPRSCDTDADKQTEPQREEAMPPDVSVRECMELPSAATDLGSEAVMVTAEMVIMDSEDRAAAESPEESPAEDLRGHLDNNEEHVMDVAGRSGTTQIDSDAAEVTADSTPVRRIVKVVSSDTDEGFSTEVAVDDHLSATPASSDIYNEKKFQPPTNRPSIRIELVPPDNIALQDDKESTSSDNQNHLLLLLGFDHSEQQLLRTARSLVQAAMNAAVDQLSREQQGGSQCVHRELQGCRDHA